MFDRRLATTLIALGLSGVVAAAAALLPSPNADFSPDEIPSAVPLARTAPITDPPEPAEEPLWLYMIKEHDGRVAVFGQDLSEPVTVLEQRVRHLPEYDRIQMAEGVEVFSDEELAARIEDYTS